MEDDTINCDTCGQQCTLIMNCDEYQTQWCHVCGSIYCIEPYGSIDVSNYPLSWQQIIQHMSIDDEVKIGTQLVFMYERSTE